MKLEIGSPLSQRLAVDSRLKQPDHPSLMVFPTHCLRILSLAIFLLYAVPLSAQREMMTFGVKGGAQLNQSFDFGSASDIPPYTIKTNYMRTPIGLTFEKPLSGSVSIAVDATYNPERFGYQQQNRQPCIVAMKAQLCTVSVTNWESHGYTLEFPVVVKQYLELGRRERFFANAGMSFRSMTLSTWADPTRVCVPPPANPTSFCSYVEDHTHGSFGFVFGGGVDFRFGHFHLYPEFRYKVWLRNEFPGSTDTLQPNQNALTVLLGFTYGTRH